MISVFDLAFYIISYYKNVNMTRLYKYIYFCHAFYMAYNNGKPLIKEPFEAWISGPMVRGLWDISNTRAYLELYLNKYANITIDEQTKLFINNVLDLCSKADIEILFEKDKDFPWAMARQGLGRMEASRNIIDNETIYTYYKDKDIYISFLRRIKNEVI
ncbi:MAG: DUF4065 domain-containing protein [Staphylococcus sp.]|nr:DUF4065 domain-containing protein [Staphylococcus sp.]